MRRSGARRLSTACRAAAALAVVFTIAADLLADSGCNALPSPSRAALSADVSADQDPCDSACVPDCYCCSRGLTSGTAVLPSDGGPVLAAFAPASAHALIGVHPSPYRPPLRLS